MSLKFTLLKYSLGNAFDNSYILIRQGSFDLAFIEAFEYYTPLSQPKQPNNTKNKTTTPVPQLF